MYKRMITHRELANLGQKFEVFRKISFPVSSGSLFVSILFSQPQFAGKNQQRFEVDFLNAILHANAKFLKRKRKISTQNANSKMLTQKNSACVAFPLRLRFRIFFVKALPRIELN